MHGPHLQLQLLLQLHTAEGGGQQDGSECVCVCVRRGLAPDSACEVREHARRSTTLAPLASARRRFCCRQPRTRRLGGFGETGALSHPRNTQH